MIIDPDSLDQIWYPTSDGGRWLTEEEFMVKWRTNAGIPTGAAARQFDSFLPDMRDLGLATSPWLANVAKGVVQNQQLQMDNFALAINSTWYNKAVLPTGMSIGGAAPWTGGTLEEFLPELGNLASGALTAIDLGGDLYAGIGTALGGEGGAVTQAIEVAEAVVGAAIGAISAIAVVNPIVGAVVAVGFGLAKAATHEADRRKAEAAAAAQQRRDDEDDFYLNLRPLPTFSKRDDSLAMDLVLARMPTTDYTSLYLPRYATNKPWFGELRQEGFVFGPGDPGGLGGIGSNRQWGEGLFVPNEYDGQDCLGMIPGTQQISDLIISRLDQNTSKYWSQEIAGGDTPKGLNSVWEGVQYGDSLRRIGEHVMDSGDFYPSSSQVLTFMWGNMQMQGASGNPDLYKLNMPYIDGEWRNYIGNAWDYLLDTCTIETYEFDRGGHSMKKLIKEGYKSQGRRMMIEANFSCALSCMFGTYRCDGAGDVIPKGNQDGKSWRSYRAGPGTPACDLDVRAFPFKGQGTACRESIYDSYLRDRIVETHQFQWKMLSASLVCAYVRESFAAFTPPSFVNDNGQAANMKEKLRAMRDLLLVRPDQWRYLVEENVPRGEDHRGNDWYELLKEKGAFTDQPGRGVLGGTAGEGYGQGGLALQSGQGFQMPAPSLMPLVGRVPMQESVPRSTRSGGGGGGLAALAALAAGAAIIRSR
jgi:hypothetical protein